MASCVICINSTFVGAISVSFLQNIIKWRSTQGGKSIQPTEDMPIEPMHTAKPQRDENTENRNKPSSMPLKGHKVTLFDLIVDSQIF